MEDNATFRHLLNFRPERGVERNVAAFNPGLLIIGHSGKKGVHCRNVAHEIKGRVKNEFDGMC